LVFFFKVRQRFPGAKDLLAQQMSHQASTQDKYYLLSQQKEDSVRMVSVIRDVMREKEHEEVYIFQIYVKKIK
jgi:hypothetical protein